MKSASDALLSPRSATASEEQTTTADAVRRQVANQVADYLRMRVDRLSRLIPSELEAEEQLCRNGEYVQLFDVQQLIEGIKSEAHPNVVVPAEGERPN